MCSHNISKHIEFQRKHQLEKLNAPKRGHERKHHLCVPLHCRGFAFHTPSSLSFCVHLMRTVSLVPGDTGSKPSLQVYRINSPRSYRSLTRRHCGPYRCVEGTCVRLYALYFCERKKKHNKKFLYSKSKSRTCFRFKVKSTSHPGVYIYIQVCGEGVQT